jgi:hypothetical protein
MAYCAAAAAFSINAATSGACERKIAWLPGSSMICDWARFVMNRYLGYRHKTRDRLRSVCSEIIRKRIGVDCQKAVANWFDALGSRWHFVCQIRQTLADVWLDGRYMNKSLDVGMHSRLGDDHPAITMADQHMKLAAAPKK